MNLKKKEFCFDHDLNLVRELLLRIYDEIGFLSYLIPTKIENHKFGPCGNTYTKEDDKDIFIWELEDHEGSIHIIAVSHGGEAANYHIEILPQYKSFEKMIFLKLEEYELLTRKNRNRIIHYTSETDVERVQALTDLNYQMIELHEYNYSFSLMRETSEIILPSGFTIKNIQTNEDIEQFRLTLGSIYPHCAEYASSKNIKFLHNAEFYHKDLDLVMIAPDGTFTSIC